MPDENDLIEENTGDDNLVWAKEVLVVYKNLGKKAGRRALGSSSAKSLHDWASNPDNQEKFLSQMMPKATDILQKARGKEDIDEVTRSEQKSIAELKSFLRLALLETEETVQNTTT